MPTKEPAEAKEKIPPSTADMEAATPEKAEGPARPRVQRATASSPDAMPPAQAAKVLSAPQPAAGAPGKARAMTTMQQTVGNTRAGQVAKAGASGPGNAPPLQRQAKHNMSVSGLSLEQESEQVTHRGSATSTESVSPIRPKTSVASTSGATLHMIQRQTASEVIAKYEDRDLNDLSQYLLGLTRQANYVLVRQVIADLHSWDRDDVAMVILAGLGIQDMIQIARAPEGLALLQLMRDEVTSGWVTGGETNKGLLLNAVVGDASARREWNIKRIEELKADSPNDLESLARLFDDDLIVDDGTVTSRLQAILSATEHLVIPGLQTGVSFGDTGFRGEPTPGGSGFRDPHPSSVNQVGHFLTAVGLQFQPGVVSRPIPLFGSIRDMVAAPRTMSDEEVALRLTIGHEKRPDPNGGLDVLADVLAVWMVESLKPGPEGETDEQREERISRAVANEIGHQINEIIAAFRAQFNATTDADIAAWNEALMMLGPNTTLNPAALEGPASPLNRIAVDPTLKGNSQQDLRLSLVGWRLGQMLSGGEFTSRAAVAYWIRRNLSATPPEPTPAGDFVPLVPPAGPGSAYG